MRILIHGKNSRIASNLALMLLQQLDDAIWYGEVGLAAMPQIPRELNWKGHLSRTDHLVSMIDKYKPTDNIIVSQICPTDDLRGLYPLDVFKVYVYSPTHDLKGIWEDPNKYYHADCVVTDSMFDKSPHSIIEYVVDAASRKCSSVGDAVQSSNELLMKYGTLNKY